jgi:hypothetical protein
MSQINDVLKKFEEFEKLTAEQLGTIGFFLNLDVTVSLQISSLELDLFLEYLYLSQPRNILFIN